MKTLRERLGNEWLFCDGGTGSVLQAKGLKGGELPELWNLTHPEDIIDLHRSYLEAGADIFNMNTFGANALKFPDRLREIVEAAAAHAKEARRRAHREDAFIALDLGPTGKLLEPLGDLAFEDAVALYGEVVRIGAAAGADLVLIETMSDTYEAKAAVLGAKENCDLPVLVTMTYDEKGKLLTGGTPESAVAMLEGLRVDALGVNCSLGPRQMLPIVRRIADAASVPVIVNPNAGLPRQENGKTVYDIDAEEFASIMGEIAALGVHVLGGCCGTTPEHIRITAEIVRKKEFHPPFARHKSVVASFSRALEIGERPLIIGERINPTGKKKFKEALVRGDIEHILSQGLEQEDAGADLLDVNVGLPEIDEPQMMETVLSRLQSIIPLPLQIDTSNIEAMERALRRYNGKALINSVNGKKESMDAVFPLVQKYGGVVVGLALDENGIPDTADGRIAIAKKIYATAAEYGIAPEDIVIDGLAMTISSDTSSALTTLETLRRVRDELRGHTILGVSNISFGLPRREIINSHFFTMAMQNGLSLAIVNPNNESMMQSYRAFLALSNLDPQCMSFIGAYAGTSAPKAAENAAGGGAAAKGAAGEAIPSGKEAPANTSAQDALTSPVSSDASDGSGPTKNIDRYSSSSADVSGVTLAQYVEKGMAERAAQTAQALLAQSDPLALINESLIPALDRVGQGFENGTLFLPQLLMSAEAAKAAFEVVKSAMAGAPRASKGRLILATVKGDIHDIGKNIVRVLLENYGYDVIDLGKDVAPETIVNTALSEGIVLIGLSALMTTTVIHMEETIRLLREKKPDTKVVVGGAVMTQAYADQIGADHYAKDAMETVRYADQVFGN